MKSLNIIVVGLGQQSLEDHLPAIRKSKYYNLIGISDTDTPVMDRTAKEYGVRCANGVSDLLEKLEEKPDVALIAVPHKEYPCRHRLQQRYHRVLQLFE